MNKKILGIGIIMILMTLVFTPTINATSSKNIKSDDETYQWTAVGCRFYVDGIWDITWHPVFGWFFIFEGNISIQKAFVLIDYDTQEKTFFDSIGYSNYDGLMIVRGFFFKHSDKPNQMEGFAMTLMLGNFNTSKK